MPKELAIFMPAFMAPFGLKVSNQFPHVSSKPIMAWEIHSTGGLWVMGPTKGFPQRGRDPFRVPLHHFVQSCFRSQIPGASRRRTIHPGRFHPTGSRKAKFHLCSARSAFENLGAMAGIPETRRIQGLFSGTCSFRVVGFSVR